MRVSDLSGAKLDYWVNRAQGETRERAQSHGIFAPSSCWNEGGPIIERERITLFADSYFVTVGSQQVWEALKNGMHTYEGLEGEHSQEGSTPLIAAMRCYVASKYGEEVADE